MGAKRDSGGRDPNGHYQRRRLEETNPLGRLVAGIAHELNNPINFIYGNVDCLEQYVEDLLGLVEAIGREPDLPPAVRRRLDAKKEEIELDFLVEDVRQLLRSIRIGAERSASIVRDLKNFSRGNVVEAMQDLDVVAGIETTLNLISPLYADRIAIERVFAPDLPKVRCHAGRVNQVFMNLLTNAVHAIEGEGVIRIAVHPVDGGSRVRVAIADTGSGIAPEIRDRVTDPFFTTKEVGEGTGLGLSISDSIVRSHGGTLELDSTPGRGSVFTVTLPVKGAQRS